MGKNTLGKVLATPNKTDDILYKIRTVAHLAEYFFPTGVKGLAIQRRHTHTQNLKREKRQHSPLALAVPAHWWTSRCSILHRVCGNIYQGWRLSQKCYHTCSYQEGNRSWIKTATRGQGLSFVSRSEDISPIYSWAGAKLSAESSEQAA